MCSFPLAAIDVDRIAQTVDVQTLQQNILHVTFCNVTSEVRGVIIITNLNIF